MKTMKGDGMMFRMALMLLSMIWWMGFSAESQAKDKKAELPTEIVLNGVEFVRIPAGWFYKTGGVAWKDRKLWRENGGNAKIWLDTFYAAKYEARGSDFVGYMNAEGYRLGDYDGDEKGCSVQKKGDKSYYLTHPDIDMPATHLSWLLADSFARWMGFRLLTEAEWEKAARGTDKRLYPWGDTFPDETYAANRGSFLCSPVPVNRFRKGVSPYGLFNMAGNVREFIADWYNEAADAALKDGVRNPPLVAEGTFYYNYNGPVKILKGGRWADGSPEVRIQERVKKPVDEPFRCNGTRFAVDKETVRDAVAKGRFKGREIQVMKGL